MRALKNIILYIVMPAVIMYLFEAYTHNPFKRMYPGIQLLNICLFILINTCFFFMTGKLRTSLHIMAAVFMILGLTEYYLVEFRGVTLLPWDLGSLKTAAEVAGGYDYIPGRRAILCIAGFVIIYIIGFAADLTVGRAYMLRAAGTAASVLLIILYTCLVQMEPVQRSFGFYTKLFTPTAMSERDGTLTAFLMELRYMNVQRPSGYDRGEAREMLSQYAGEKPDSQSADIIVVMNETFADLRMLGDFETSEDYMPFVHSLQNGVYGNVVTGELGVSIVGGNTPNTEFEFLTGNTLAFLPEGSIPYQQYVREGIEAMPGYLAANGYETLAMHPYLPGGWNRESVYPALGFDRSMFIKDFDADAPILREYVSDMGCSEEIIEQYEKIKSDGKKAFIFNVTMQNHSPYDKDYANLPIEVRLTGAKKGKETLTAERYLTLIKKSDEAFEYLVRYFEDRKEPVVVVMFGDHQPSDSLVRPVWSLMGVDSRALDERQVERRYTVPYVIWANFDISGKQGVDTSANLLGERVLDIAGAGSYPYMSFIKEISARYPVLSAVRTVDAAGHETDAADIKDDELMNRYRILQYYELFDRE